MTLGVRLKECITAEIKKRCGSMEFVKSIAFATILDPRFKNLHFQNPEACASAISGIRQMLKTSHSTETETETELTNSDKDSLYSGTESYNFWELHNKLSTEKASNQNKTYLVDELSMYLSTPVIPITTNPLQQWKDMETLYPKLYKVAMKYLSVVATSVPSGRLFSKAGATVSQFRDRLLGSRIQKLIFLGSIPETEWFH